MNGTTGAQEGVFKEVKLSLAGDGRHVSTHVLAFVEHGLVVLVVGPGELPVAPDVELVSG